MTYVKRILQAISILLAVASFLLNAGRALKAIEFEAWFLLNNKAPSIEKQLRQFIQQAIYDAVFKAYRRVGNQTNALECGRKLLATHRECGDSQEGMFSMSMAQIYRRQSMYAEAKKNFIREKSLSCEQLLKEERKRSLIKC